MPAHLGVETIFGLTAPVGGCVQESSREESVELADGLINQLLAENNDKSAAPSEFLANRTVEARFWST